MDSGEYQIYENLWRTTDDGGKYKGRTPLYRASTKNSSQDKWSTYPIYVAYKKQNNVE